MRKSWTLYLVCLGAPQKVITKQQFLYYYCTTVWENMKREESSDIWRLKICRVNKIRYFHTCSYSTVWRSPSGMFSDVNMFSCVKRLNHFTEKNSQKMSPPSVHSQCMYTGGLSFHITIVYTEYWTRIASTLFWCHKLYLFTSSNQISSEQRALTPSAENVKTKQKVIALDSAHTVHHSTQWNIHLKEWKEKHRL